MSCNWAGNLDMLAQNGVLDFDGASYIMGQKPRYVGNPTRPNPFNGQPPSIPNLQQPEIDEFKPQTQKEDKSPKITLWKKLAFGALAIGVLGLGIYKFKSISTWCKNQFKKINFKNIKDFVVDKSKAVGRFFKKGWNNFIGLFRKKKP